MRPASAALLPFLWLAANAWPQGTAGNVIELGKLLNAGQTPLVLEAAPAERGCGPKDCVIDIADLTIVPRRGVLQTAGKRRIKLVQHAQAPSPGLPDIDWESVRGFKVFRAGTRWGSCLEFSHAGLGNSGRLQRWTSVVLVPRAGSSAHRFVGFWASCSHLSAGGDEGEVKLPSVVPAAADATSLGIVWHHCDLKACSDHADFRPVGGDPFGWQASITLGSKPE